MKIIKLLSLIFLLSALVGCGTDSGLVEEKFNLEVPEGIIYGTLIIPEGNGPFKTAIIHQGSGPTDRDGNSQIAGTNNSLKMLAEALAEEGIASVRYDKRGIAASMSLIEKEEDLIFEDYINDLILWIDKVNKDDRLGEVYLIGHSEGALIAAAAAGNAEISGYVSIAGTGYSAYDTLVRQLSTQPKEITDMTTPILDELKAGNLVPDVPDILAALFRNSVQPYMISWFKYDPVAVYKEIEAPILIIQGDNDLQVTVDDAKALGEGTGNEPIIIPGMNHVLKDAPTDAEGNFKTYQDPELELNILLKEEVIRFILEN